MIEMDDYDVVVEESFIAAMVMWVGFERGSVVKRLW